MQNSVDDSEPPMTLRQRIQLLVDGLPPDKTSVQAVVETLGREGSLVLAIVLSLPFLLPVQIPGVSTLFGALILLLGLGQVLNRKPWLPSRIQNRELTSAMLRNVLEKGMRWVERLERWSKPRLARMTQGTTMRRFNGAMIVLGAALLMLPLAIVPFTNTLPALAILFICVGVLQRDGGCVVAGIVFNILTIAYFTTIAVLGVAGVMELYGISQADLPGAPPQPPSYGSEVPAAPKR